MENIISGTMYEYKLRLKLLNRLVLVGGSSGVGKSLIFSYLDKLSNYQDKEKYLCINSVYASKIRRSNECEEEAILNIISDTSNKCIIIDNADVLLTPKLRECISCDTKNQYLLFGRNVEGLWINENKIADLVIDKKNKCFELYYRFKESTKDDGNMGRR